MSLPDSEDKRPAQLLIVDLRITVRIPPPLKAHDTLLSCLPKTHLALALRISKPLIHPMALPRQQKRSPPTTAPMGSLIMISSCYQLRICSSWASSHLLRQSCAFLEYTNLAASFLMRFSKSPLRPYTSHENIEGSLQTQLWRFRFKVH